jgi:hypothetical protein
VAETVRPGCVSTDRSAVRIVPDLRVCAQGELAVAVLVRSLAAPRIDPLAPPRVRGGAALAPAVALQPAVTEFGVLLGSLPAMTTVPIVPLVGRLGTGTPDWTAPWATFR